MLSIAAPCGIARYLEQETHTMSDLKTFIKRTFPPQIVKILRLLRHPNLFDVVTGPLTYNQDGLATKHNCDFLQDPRFMASYRLGEQAGSWTRDGKNLPIHYRVYIMLWAADRVKYLEGDYVECGVYKGSGAMALINYVGLSQLPKKFYLLDTFRGLPEEYVSEEETDMLKLNKIQYTEDIYDSVKERFRPYSNVVIIRGAIPDTLPQLAAQKACFLHLDMNYADAEIAAAEYLWDKLVPGASVVLDDYGFLTHYVQKRDFDAFAARKGVPILSLPTGQGLIIKP
jgi:O-methyltransferase